MCVGKVQRDSTANLIINHIGTVYGNKLEYPVRTGIEVKFSFPACFVSLFLILHILVL